MDTWEGGGKGETLGLFFFFFHSVDQAGLELRNPPASASRVLGLKACATTPRLPQVLYLMLDFPLRAGMRTALTWITKFHLQ